MQALKTKKTKRGIGIALSTHIEGTTLTLKQSENILLRNNPKGTRRDDLELINYMKVFNLASKTGRVRIGETDIKKYHSILVKGVGEEASLVNTGQTKLCC